MLILKYDGSFEGFLTLVFECFEQKLKPENVVKNAEYQIDMFSAYCEIITDYTKAKRLWNGLHKRISTRSCQMVYYVFLSEENNIELLILRYIRKVFSSSVNIEANFGDVDVLAMLQIDKKVLKEAGRIPMFVRFQKTADGIYYASYDPQYNVLPIVTEHFEKRFADQKWIIYDTRREYGYFYDLNTTIEVRFEEGKVNPADGSFDESLMAEDEKQFQELWKNYFTAICIKERLNPKLHVKLLPKRYWKYLIEKKQ